jgi:GT2 family glycosyltransferase
MTCRAINTLLWSEDDEYSFKIRVVESNKDYMEQGFVYNGRDVLTIVPNDDFGYNKFLNYGLDKFKKKSDWVVITNNDVIFTRKWFTKLMKVNKAHPEFKSLSPWEPNWHKKRGMKPDREFYEGYRTSYEITGWCLVMKQEVIDKCTLFDPQFEFWYQDNDYTLTLEVNKIKHALCTDSRVYHSVSGSHDTISEKNRHHMTDNQINVLYRKWGTNV